MLFFLILVIVCVVVSVVFWTVPRSGKDIVSAIYMLLAFFWLIAGIHVFYFYDELTQVMRMPASRETAAVIFAALFAYNIFRWRLSRRRTQQPKDEPTRFRRRTTYDPNLDFTRPDADAPPDTKDSPK